MSKLEKLKTELARAKKKSGEWQARVRDIEKQITECENMEILQTVRSIATSPEELRGLLDMLRASKEPPQAGPAENKKLTGGSEQYES